jgi:hypothetical protein
MTSKSRYAILTVDTEALPKRASRDHVKRLIWGEHERGTAGIREMCVIGDEVNAKHVFFVDVCGAYSYGDEVKAVIHWLDQAGQDVQLHVHPEYLPQEFWLQHGIKYRPRFLNQYDDAKAEFTIGHFSKVISGITGKPILAFRAGSFRWNANTIRALGAAGIPLSFNNSMRAFADGQCLYSEPTNIPYAWSNGIIEVPVTERKVVIPFSGKQWWQKLQFPLTNRFPNPPWAVLRPYLGKQASLLVLLMHSWSLLYWDEEGHAVYWDDRRLEDYRKLVHRLVKDYDIITTTEFLDLHARGKIVTTHTVDLATVGHDSERQILISGHSQPQTSPFSSPLSDIDASFERLLQETLRPSFAAANRSVSLLSHTPLNTVQRKMLEGFADIHPSVLSSWQDLADPVLASQAADLPGYKGESVDLFISSGVLDFLVDFSGVIANTARILAPGGHALFRLKRQRLVAGEAPPSVAYSVDPLTVGLPAGTTLPSMKVGRAWLLDALGTAGLLSTLFEYRNEETGEIIEWFVGCKPAKSRQRSCPQVQLTRPVHTI